MDDYLMGDDFTDPSASKPETRTYSRFEADLNAKLLQAQTKKLQETIKWLKRRMPTHDQQQIVLDQMTYGCIAVIPAGKNWLDRLLQVLQHVLFLRRYGGDDAQGPKPVTPDEMRAAIKESGLLPGGMGSEAYSRDSIFSSRSGLQEGSNATGQPYSSDEETQKFGEWSPGCSEGSSLSSRATTGFLGKRKR